MDFYTFLNTQERFQKNVVTGFCTPHRSPGVSRTGARAGYFLIMLFESFDLFGAIKFLNAMLYILSGLRLSTYCFNLAAPQPAEAV